MATSNMERAFLLRCATAGLRGDGRAPAAFREAAFAVDAAQRGHVVCTFGAPGTAQSSRVLAVVTATIVRPHADRPSDGLVGYYLELSPGSLSLEAAAAAAGAGDDASAGEGDRLQRAIERILKGGRVVDQEALCIVPGEHVWSIRVSLHVLDSGGNVLDCAVAAALAALSDFGRPAVSLHGPEGRSLTVHSPFERHLEPLTLNAVPISVSFLLADPETESSDHATKRASSIVALADPTAAEEGLLGGRAAGRLTIVLGRHARLLSITKGGGQAVAAATIERDCLAIAMKRAPLLLDQIAAAIRAARTP